MLRQFLLGALVVLLIAGCGSPEPPPQVSDPGVYRDEERFGLSFEERMAVPSRLSILHAEAQRRANRTYSKFRSRTDAVLNEEYTGQLKDEATQSLLKDLGLTQEQLDQIVEEYQRSLGAPLR